jgi:hypothetical protein
MVDYEKRNLEILRMRKEGKSLRQLSSSFGVSFERVRQIILCSELGKEIEERAEKTKQCFRSLDDIEKKWPKDIIIVGLLFPKAVTWRLKKYFEGHDIQEVSLKDIMDLLIQDKKRRPTDLFEVVPAFKENQFGKITVYAMIKHLSEQDLGDSFNTEWDKRLESLRRYFKRIGQNVPSELRKYLY